MSDDLKIQIGSSEPSGPTRFHAAMDALRFIAVVAAVVVLTLTGHCAC